MPKGISPYTQRAGTTLSERLNHYSIPEPNSGCLLWLGMSIRRGYGMMRWDGRMQLSHRLSWINTYGPIPEGLFVCHHCDVPACINPAHLFIGPAAANVADKMKKGRHRVLIGQDHKRSKLTDDQVREIRSSTESKRALATKYKVSRLAIERVQQRIYWKHLK
jgi:hypothetical protein